MRTAKPTKTVEALNAGLKMEEKFSKLPRHLMSGSGMIPLEVGAELVRKMQNFHNPKWPGLLDLSVAPTQWRHPEFYIGGAKHTLGANFGG